MSRRSIFVEHATLKFHHFLGTSMALFCAVAFLLLWAWSRAASSRWHEVIVEAAAMIGFINLFTMQRAQNKDIKAIHIKLDELIASSEFASNRLIKAEDAPEHVLDQVHEMYKEAAMGVKDDLSRTTINLDQADDVMRAHHHNLLDPGPQVSQIDMRPVEPEGEI